LIICEVCGKEAPKRGKGHQKYCPECSAQKNIERKRAWYQKSRPNSTYDPEKQKVKRTQAISNATEKGIEISNENKRSITWAADDEDNTDTLVRVAIPFEYGISKNAAWSFAGGGNGGHVYLREKHKNIRELLTLHIKQACRNIEWYEDKVWIDILVQKPNHQGDAVNVIDAVCDAVKVAIGVDDRWFSIKRLDWEIAKDKPMLYVGISQKSEGHKRICSYCGRILSLDNFNKRKDDKLGVGRECHDCRRARPKKKN